jgi:hypothetical protein
MNRKPVCIVLLWAMVILSVPLAGCSHRSVVGVWEVQGGPGPATFTFQADGNFKTEASMPGRSSTVTGQYEQRGDSLVFKTMRTRTATVRRNSDDEIVVTGDDGVSKTLKRKK